MSNSFDSLMPPLLLIVATTTIHPSLRTTKRPLSTKRQHFDVTRQQITLLGVAAHQCRSLAAVVSIAAVILPNACSQCALSKDERIINSFQHLFVSYSLCFSSSGSVIFVCGVNDFFEQWASVFGSSGEQVERSGHSGQLRNIDSANTCTHFSKTQSLELWNSCWFSCVFFPHF